MSVNLFVYGTLKAGEPQGGLLAGATRRVAATTRGRLYHLDAGYPALTVEGRDIVHGELVTIPDSRILGVLDAYEGVDEGLYRRIERRVSVGLTTEVAWMWVMDEDKARLGRHLRKGRWTAVVRR